MYGLWLVISNRTMAKRNNKGKCPAKGPPQKKVKIIKKNKRPTWAVATWYNQSPSAASPSASPSAASPSSSSTITYEEGGEEVEISKFTALNVKPMKTSSPRPGRTGSGCRSSPSPTPPRQKFTCEQKNLARELKKDGKQPQEIIEIFKQRYGVVLKSSTLSTWYNTTNMANHEQRGPTNTSMASVETHVNPTQRPTILIDMEFALVSMIKKSNNIGSVTRKGNTKENGKKAFQ